MKELKGILPPIVSPFDARGEVDHAALRRIMQHQLKAGVHGFYVCGGTGEGVLLNVKERQAMLETVIDEANGRALIIAHIGAFQTADTLTLARHASRVGADAVAALPPSYFFKPDMQGLVRYYTAVAQAASVPLLVYNLPARTGITLTRAMFERLVQIPNVVGMKDSSGNLFQLGLHFSGGKKPVIFSGDDGLLAYALMAGACGGIGASYNIMPQLYVKVWNEVQAKNLAAAVATQLRINKITNALLSVEVIAGVKQTMAWLGLPCGDPRTPNRPLSDEERALLRQSFESVRFFSEGGAPHHEEVPNG